MGFHLDQATLNDVEKTRLALIRRQDRSAFRIIAQAQARREKAQRVFLYFIERRAAP